MYFTGNRLELRPAVHSHLGAIGPSELNGRHRGDKTGEWCEQPSEDVVLHDRCNNGFPPFTGRTWLGLTTDPVNDVTGKIGCELSCPQGLFEAGFRVTTNRLLDRCEPCRGLVRVVTPFSEVLGELRVTFPETSKVALFNSKLGGHDIENM